MSDKPMTNCRAIKALGEVKLYANSRSLDAVNYAIAVLEKLEEAGIKNPLESFTASKDK